MDYIFLSLVFGCVFVIGITIFTIIQDKKYKHKVQIRELVNGRKVIIHDRAKSFVDESGADFWKLKKEKNPDRKLIMVPPPDCIELDDKGKKNVVMYRDDNGNVVFAKDSTYDFKHLKNFDPVTSGDKVVMIGQIKKARDRSGHDWRQNLPMFVGGAMLVVVIVLAAVFMEDVAKPFIQSKELQVQQMELMKEIVLIQQETKSDVQAIKGEIGLGDVGGGDVPD